MPVQDQYDIHKQLIIPSLSVSSQPVTDSGGGVSTLEMKYRADASIANVTEFEPSVDTFKRLITYDDVAAVVISESTISAERPVEEEGTYTCWDKNTLVVKRRPVAMPVVLSSAFWDEFIHFGSHHDMLVEIKIQNACSNVDFWMGTLCRFSLRKLLRML